MPEPIQTRSLLLRGLTVRDAPKVFAMSQEPGLRMWLPDQVYGDEAAAVRVLTSLIAQYDDPEAPVDAPLVLGVCLRDGGELIGHVGLSPFPGGVEIGYAIAEAQQGRGFASEAVRALAEWGTGARGLEHVFAIVARDNAASCRVLEKAGFELLSETTRPLHGVPRRVRTYRR